MTTTNYGATCTTIDGDFVVTNVFPVDENWDGYRFHGYCRPTEEEIKAAGFETTAYIKGFFRPSAAAVRMLKELGITNPAGYEKASEGLWDSITVPYKVFKHTPGNPGTPGKLEIL